MPPIPPSRPSFPLTPLTPQEGTSKMENQRKKIRPEATASKVSHIHSHPPVPASPSPLSRPRREPPKWRITERKSVRRQPLGKFPSSSPTLPSQLPPPPSHAPGGNLQNGELPKENPSGGNRSKSFPHPLPPSRPSFPSSLPRLRGEPPKWRITERKSVR